MSFWAFSGQSSDVSILNVYPLIAALLRRYILYLENGRRTGALLISSARGHYITISIVLHCTTRPSTMANVHETLHCIRWSAHVEITP
jgi:hypothetical protein